MTKKTTISTIELFKLFPDADTARVYLEGRLWPNGVKCRVCGDGSRITVRHLRGQGYEPDQ